MKNYQVIFPTTSVLPKVMDENGNIVENANVSVSFSTDSIDNFNGNENYINGITAKVSINGTVYEAEIVRCSDSI